MSAKNYTMLHCHTDLSNGITNIDSINNYKQFVDKAVEYGMTSFAFSEHGSIFEWLHKKQYIEKNGLKYIHAEEFYVTEDINNKVRDNYHCLLFAKNKEGFYELNKLSSKAFNRETGNFYYNPRISFDDLINTSDNIIITTGCLRSILNVGSEPLKEKYIEFLSKNKHRCFLEIQPHLMEDQIEYNKYLYKLSKDIDVRLVIGTDTHILSDKYVKPRSVLQKSKGVSFPEEDKCDLVFRDYDTLMVQLKKQKALPVEEYEIALENTNIIASMVEEYDIDDSHKYPKLYDNPKDVLLKRINEGIIERGIDKYPNYQEYLDRIEYELKAFDINKAENFILLEYEYKKAMREKNIPYGVSRGSVSGSIIAYILKVTDMDSIKYKLNFDRYMNTSRVSLSDIDSDWYKDDRENVRDYLYNREGLNCCDIITFNTIALKGAFKDVARAYGIPIDVANKVTKNLDANEDKYRKEYKDIFEIVDLIKGTIVSIGIHPAACVVSEYELQKEFGLFTSSTTKRPISQINMKEIDSLNYVKLDILGLDAVGLINKTCDMAGIERLTPDNFDLNDEDVWNSIGEDSTCIFQFESDFAQIYIRKVLNKNTIDKFKERVENFNYLDILSMANSALRPAGASYRNALAEGKFADNGHEVLNKFLSNTGGYLVYQEQIIEFLNKFCGYSMGEADLVRRCVHEDTDILLSNGKTKKIKDIIVGDKVITINNGLTAINPVENVFNNGLSKVYKIKTIHEEEIIATEEHKFYTQDGWKKLKELDTESDSLMLLKKCDFETDNLKSNKRLTSDEMFLIGMLIGDGTLSCSNPSFTNSDKDLIEKFKQCINIRRKGKSNSKFKITKTKGKTVDFIYNIKVNDNISKKSLNNLLNRYDLKKLSSEKYIHKDLMMYPPDTKLYNLLGGLYSTDGISSKKYIGYATISKTLSKDIKSLLLKCGIYSYISKSSVKGYDYYSYDVRIVGKNSIEKFKNCILPYVVGNKKEKYKNFVDTNKSTYNYLLPSKCTEEIIKNSYKYKTSINSTGISIKKQYRLTDTKGVSAYQEVYSPYTYWLINSNLMPVGIKSIEYVGKANVYDIQVANNHNYVANNIIVHNCFAKKIGTKEHLPNIKAGFIKYMKDKYDIDKEESEELVTNFIKVIEDSSDYVFSVNHSHAYSIMGYMCAWLRYYYPLEFISVAFDVYNSDLEKISQIHTFCNKKGIKILPMKYGKSKADYFIDKENNSIYKGVKSVKHLNEKSADDLFEISKKYYYDYFYELLLDMKKYKIDSKKIDTLIKLNFFEEFGEERKLLAIFDNLIYFKYGNASSISSEKYENIKETNPILFNVLEKYISNLNDKGKELKTYKILYIDSILQEYEDEILKSDIKNFSIYEKISMQVEYTESLLPTGKVEDRKNLYITEIFPVKRKKDNKQFGYNILAQSIGSGKSNRFTIFNSTYNKCGEVDIGDIIRCNKYTKDGIYYTINDYDKIIKNI